MSKATKDLGRVLISEFTDFALEIERRARKRDKQELVREILNAWAAERHAAYRLAAKKSQANELQMELDVDDVEDDGQPSKGRR